MSKYLKLANGRVLCTTDNKLIDLIGNLQPAELFKYADTYRVVPELLGDIEYIGECQDPESFYIDNCYDGEFERFSLDASDTLTCKLRVWDLSHGTIYSSFVDVITQDLNNTCFSDNSLIGNDFLAGAFLGKGDLPIAVTVMQVSSNLLDPANWSDWFLNKLSTDIDATNISISINEIRYLNEPTLLFFTYSNKGGAPGVDIHGLRLGNGTTIVDLEFLSLGSNLGSIGLINNNNNKWKNLLNALDNTNKVTKINYTTDTDYNTFSTNLSASRQEFPIQPGNIQKIYGPAFAFRDYSTINNTVSGNSDFRNLIGCYYTIEPNNWSELGAGMCIDVGINGRVLFSATAFTGAIWDNTEAFKLSTNFLAASARAFTFENKNTPGAESWAKAASMDGAIRLEIEPAAMFIYYDYPRPENWTTAPENQIQNPISKDFVYSMFNGNDEHSDYTEELLFGGNYSTEDTCSFTRTDGQTSGNSPYNLKTGYGVSSSFSIDFTFYVDNTLDGISLIESGFFISDSCNVYGPNSIRSYTNIDTSFIMYNCASHFISFPLAPLWKSYTGDTNISAFQSITVTITQENAFYDTERISIFLRHLRSTTDPIHHPTSDELYLLGNNYVEIQSGNNSFTCTFDRDNWIFNSIINDGDNIENDSIVIWLGVTDDVDLDSFNYPNLTITVTTA